jgi:hypothetical protein
MMLTKRSTIVLFATALALWGSATAHAAVEIQNVEGSPLPEGISDEQIQKVMVSAGMTRGWVVKAVGPGHMEGTLLIRTHMAKVDIVYDATGYSIRYKDSENLGYKNGKIHRNYNKWVQNLDMDIQRTAVLL